MTSIFPDRFEKIQECNTTITSEHVDYALQMLREQFGNKVPGLRPLEERGKISGDFVQILKTKDPAGQNHFLTVARRGDVFFNEHTVHIYDCIYSSMSGFMKKNIQSKVRSIITE